MGMSCNVNKYFISVCLYYFCMLAELCVYHSDKYRNVKGFDTTQTLKLILGSPLRHVVTFGVYNAKVALLKQLS